MDRLSRPSSGHPANAAVQRSALTSVKVQRGKFLCGLRVATRPEPTTSRFSMMDYVVIMGPSNSEVISSLFDILSQGEQGYDEISHKDFIAQPKIKAETEVAPVKPGWLSPRGEAFLNGKSDIDPYVLQEKKGSNIPIAKPKVTKVESKKTNNVARKDANRTATKTATPVPGNFSDRAGDFLNGSSDEENITDIVHRVILTGMARSSLATPASRPNAASTSASSCIGKDPRPLVCNASKGQRVVFTRDNSFGLVISPEAAPRSQRTDFGPSVRLPDNEASKCKVYVHKVTKKIFVRDAYRLVYRALTQEEVVKIDGIEEERAFEEDNGFEWVDDVPYM